MSASGSAPDLARPTPAPHYRHACRRTPHRRPRERCQTYRGSGSSPYRSMAGPTTARHRVLPGAPRDTAAASMKDDFPADSGRPVLAAASERWRASTLASWFDVDSRTSRSPDAQAGYTPAATLERTPRAGLIDHGKGASPYAHLSAVEPLVVGKRSMAAADGEVGSGYPRGPASASSRFGSATPFTGRPGGCPRQGVRRLFRRHHRRPAADGGCGSLVG